MLIPMLTPYFYRCCEQKFFVRNGFKWVYFTTLKWALEFSLCRDRQMHCYESVTMMWCWILKFYIIICDISYTDLWSDASRADILTTRAARSTLSPSTTSPFTWAVTIIMIQLDFYIKANHIIHVNLVKARHLDVFELWGSVTQSDLLVTSSVAITPNNKTYLHRNQLCTWVSYMIEMR